MARPVWSGALTFGLVSMPVQMFTATDRHTIRFHQLQRGTSDRVRNKRVNERTGKEVPLDEIVKAYDAGDAYVLVEPDELDDIAPGRSRTLEITGFVELTDVAPIFFDKTYYLGPKTKDYAKVYALLEKALADTGRAGIATFVMRNHQYLVALKSEAGLLTLHTLHWADEIRDPRQEIGTLPGRTKVTDRELKMARQLVDTLRIEWRPEDYRDTYQDQVTALIEAKRTGEAVEKAEPPAESTNVVDLMDTLRASVERGGKPSRRDDKKSARDTITPPTHIRDASAKRRSAGKKKRKAGDDHDHRPLDVLTKAELYRRAADAEIPGRSSMNRKALLDALRKGTQHKATS
ncbi:putative DNA repair protein YkoV [Streptomyces sp. YIM 130001]|uniref:non-homologous end joining protein Ku n=1 Tax=Streptomyces sp. YIM 130001 TaxID=2259644 RepID=UPI000E646EF1|nr:Ku protein [Streptomyces sp. YIM 130001]RII17929.1 putative DNA repair protein YkoV [Streptomyces sp. YIM 130001]